jgi:hypothetical protein
MARCAPGRPGLFSGFFHFFMTFGAKLVHDIFFFKFALCLEFFDTACFLRKHGMTYLAITEIFPVLLVGKGDFTYFATINFDVVGDFSIA